MKYNRFEELPVWKDAASLAADIYRWSSQTVFRGKGDLANQLQRAALSISNNIAEGFERGTTSELLAFLYYARGSAGEVRSMLCVMDMMGDFNNLKSEISNFKSKSESIARQIRGWANSLQNINIAGQRHLNSNSKAVYDSEKRADAFMQKIDKMVEDAREKRGGAIV
ncbi:four helix bundle protein [Limihaloglobus sulfuriphilus]|uniref:Four helix bundle protein n=1 Tax=Limihaloglobus sulfuriphilus TaxID=1851148 RepID=A0A1Q2MAR7_9BACT|nr:four helix bundle protein [Limihaloglobus sulfuriphilus]AQQ69764.1 four helix bundle protein [Limihaloglobus sulfuriphilus]